MADMALLVTEEFERKLRRGAAGSGEDEAGMGRRNFGAVITVCSSWMESASASAAAAAAGVKVNVARLNVVEPRTGPAMAALDGFFSA
ncbi:hypothetical protein ABZP36_017825 [Zizania latifolia]